MTQPLLDHGPGPPQLSRGQMYSHQYERLLKGQSTLQIAIEELQRSVDRLPAAVLGSLGSISAQGGACAAAPTDHDNVVQEDAGPAPLPIAPSPLALGVTPGYAAGRSTSSHGLDTPSPQHFAAAASFLDHRTSTQQGLLAGASPYQPHQDLLDFHQAMVRTNYVHVGELARQHLMTKRKELSRSLSFAPEQKAGWTPPLNSLILHPASKRRSVFDCLIVIFLVLDAVVVPYAIAWDIPSDVVWLSFISWVIAIFWSIDVLLNFCTGYIKGNTVEMGWKSIAKRYIRGGFTVDMFVLIVEYVHLVASNFSDIVSGNGSLKVVKVLRFLKITRLVRVIARLRAGLVNRIETTIAYWIQRYGLVGWEHYITFAQILLKLFFVIAWLSHLGSCIWYSLEVAISGDGADSWYNDLLATTWKESEMYVHGFYWAVSTMFSGSSYIPPLKPLEAAFSMSWLVMGALFVTSITSTLAAKVIDTQEKMGEAMKKMRILNTFMGQRKTPVLLALAVQANFNEQLFSPVKLTELDIPFLSNVTPGLRAALRECHYAPLFAQLPLFRMLQVLSSTAMQTFCFAATQFALAREGQEMFSAKQPVEQAIILCSGSVQYSRELSDARPANGGGGGRQSIIAPSPGEQQQGEGTPTSPTSPKEGGTRSQDSEDGPSLSQLAKAPEVHHLTESTWICEMALLTEWETVGALQVDTHSELLLVSADAFIKLVRQTPVMAAVVSSYAAQMCEALDFNVRNYGPEGMPTDINLLVDHDVVIANLHLAVRSDLISLPVIDVLRRQQNIVSGLMRWRSLADLEEEVVAGKCHLISGPTPGVVHRVVRLVVLRIINLEGLLCVQLAEKRGENYAPKFHLPGRKVEGNSRPADVVQKLLDDDFKVLAPYIKLEKVDTVVESEDSHSYGFTTKYIKFIQNAVLMATMESNARCEEILDFHTSHNLSGLARIGHGPVVGQVFAKKSAASEVSYQESFAAVCSHPFTTEGSHHCFGLSEMQSPHASHIKIYKWLQTHDFDNLHNRRNEVENELMVNMFNGLSPDRLERLTQWNFKPMTESESLAARAAVALAHNGVFHSHRSRVMDSSEPANSQTAAAFAAASFQKEPEAFLEESHNSGLLQLRPDDQELWDASV